jgi:hypothetical protein
VLAAIKGDEAMPEPMTDKQKADCLIALHDTQMDHFRQTREIEFKVNLALWAAIVLSGKFLQGQVYLDNFSSWLFFLFFAAIVTVVHLLCWMMPIQRSEDLDNHFIMCYRKEVERLVGTKFPRLEDRQPRCLWGIVDTLRPYGWSWIIFEVAITLFLLIGVGAMLTVSNKQSSNGNGRQAEVHAAFSVTEKYK